MGCAVLARSECRWRPVLASLATRLGHQAWQPSIRWTGRDARLLYRGSWHDPGTCPNHHRPMRILIVDDESSIRKTTAVALESMGHQAEDASNSEEAARLLESSRFDIVLLDPPYTLPGHMALLKIDTLVAPGGVVVLEHARRAPAPEHAGRLVRVRQVTSGDSMLTFYETR